VIESGRDPGITETTLNTPGFPGTGLILISCPTETVEVKRMGASTGMLECTELWSSPKRVDLG
jgi:hypothetical protein